MRELCRFFPRVKVEKQKMPARALRQSRPGLPSEFWSFVEKQKMPARALRRSRPRCWLLQQQKTVEKQKMPARALRPPVSGSNLDHRTGR